MGMVDLPTAGVDYHVTFGGRKGSSYGPREQGKYVQEFFTTMKTALHGCRLTLRGVLFVSSRSWVCWPCWPPLMRRSRRRRTGW